MDDDFPILPIAGVLIGAALIYVGISQAKTAPAPGQPGGPGSPGPCKPGDPGCDGPFPCPPSCVPPNVCNYSLGACQVPGPATSPGVCSSQAECGAGYACLFGNCVIPPPTSCLQTGCSSTSNPVCNGVTGQCGPQVITTPQCPNCNAGYSCDPFGSTNYQCVQGSTPGPYGLAIWGVQFDGFAAFPVNGQYVFAAGDQADAFITITYSGGGNVNAGYVRQSHDFCGDQQTGIPFDSCCEAVLVNSFTLPYSADKTTFQVDTGGLRWPTDCADLARQYDIAAFVQALSGNSTPAQSNWNGSLVVGLAG